MNLDSADTMTVDVCSKSEYYDNDKILSKWGFNDDHCYNCGKHNSDLDGLLMQCGKCKQAYYCNMRCFNDHLPEHQKFCGTKQICCRDPKGRKVEFKKKPIVEKEAEELLLKKEAPKKTKKSKKKKKKDKEPEPEPIEQEAVPIDQENPPIESVEYEMVSEIEKELASLQVEDKAAEYEAEQNNTGEEEDDDEEEGEMSLGDLKQFERPKPDQGRMHHSFSEFGRGPPRNIPARETHEHEKVDLKHAELMKREYEWMTPDWINAQLRKTHRGRELLESGNLSGPVTDVSILIEQGLISWEKPEWAKPEWTTKKLRKTKGGDLMKQEAELKEKEWAEERETLEASFGHVSAPDLS